jgi:UDP-N-acetylglucosamine 2-epimerase (non-hydrolysing)
MPVTKIAVVVGTRPEAVKMAPVVQCLRTRGDVECVLVSTGQHREMLTRTLDIFGLRPDVDLQVMTQNQSLAGLSSRLFSSVDAFLSNVSFDWLLVQGDTSTAMVASVCAFYRGVRVGHVEAGLRSRDMHAPFPEEFNRRVTGLVADLHFAPTPGAAQNLLAEGVPADRIHVTGNTGIDALLQVVQEVERVRPHLESGVPEFVSRFNRLVLITGHRRENFGPGFAQICAAIAELAGRFPDVGFLYPVHLNPNVQEPVRRLLGGRPNIMLAEPVDYPGFVWLMSRSHLLLSDSGGVQEEAPSLGKPVLVMREVTERPEGIEAGCSMLVGSSAERIMEATSRLLCDEPSYSAMARARNPYGDGQARFRIADALLGATRAGLSSPGTRGEGPAMART